MSTLQFGCRFNACTIANSFLCKGKQTTHTDTSVRSADCQKTAGAYPRFKKWGTNHGEREERGAESAEGGGREEEVSPPYLGGVWGGGYVFSPDFFRFLSSNWQVLVHSES